MLIEQMLTYGMATEEQLIHALGAHRHTATLNEFELAIVDSGLVNDLSLLQLKGSVLGLPILDSLDVKVDPSLPPDVAAAAGALKLDTPVLTVAMIEPTEYNVAMVSSSLGTHSFDVWLVTASSFDQRYQAAYHNRQGDFALPPAPSAYDLLTESIELSASDLHLSVGRPPIIRQHGTLVSLRYDDLDMVWMTNELPKLVGEARLSHLSENHDVDAAITFGNARFRVNVGEDFHGPTVALRKIPVKIPTMEELGLPPAAQQLTELERGFVIVTGPTGSGKSTTLASMLSHIAKTSARHIITLEDPIEYHLPSGISVVNQRELYESFNSFPAGLRQALRQDPDVILVGELRDPETIRTALTAAETGHLVFATLHTYDAVATMSRIVSSFSAEEQDHVRAQLAYILKGVISQTLLRLHATAGRVAAFEVMLATPAIQANLRKLDGHNQLRQTMETSRQQGMQTMEIALVDLVRSGKIEQKVGEFAAQNRESFLKRLALSSQL